MVSENSRVDLSGTLSDGPLDARTGLRTHPCGLVVNGTYRRPGEPFGASPVYAESDVHGVVSTGMRQYVDTKFGAEPVAWALCSQTYFKAAIRRKYAG